MLISIREERESYTSGRKNALAGVSFPKCSSRSTGGAGVSPCTLGRVGPATQPRRRSRGMP